MLGRHRRTCQRRRPSPRRMQALKREWEICRRDSFHLDDHRQRFYFRVCRKDDRSVMPGSEHEMRDDPHIECPVRDTYRASQFFLDTAWSQISGRPVSFDRSDFPSRRFCETDASGNGIFPAVVDGSGRKSVETSESGDRALIMRIELVRSLEIRSVPLSDLPPARVRTPEVSGTLHRLETLVQARLETRRRSSFSSAVVSVLARQFK
jgi:hypothetical protein